LLETTPEEARSVICFLTLKWQTYDHLFQVSLPITQLVCCHFAPRYVWKNLYLFFGDEITCFLYFTKNLDFFWKTDFFENLWRKSEEKSHQMENCFKKSENFTTCIYYNDKHRSVNSISMSFYNLNLVDIENKSKVRIAIKY